MPTNALTAVSSPLSISAMIPRRRSTSCVASCDIPFTAACAIPAPSSVLDRLGVAQSSERASDETGDRLAMREAIERRRKPCVDAERWIVEQRGAQPLPFGVLVDGEQYLHPIRAAEYAVRSERVVVVGQTWVDDVGVQVAQEHRRRELGRNVEHRHVEPPSDTVRVALAQRGEDEERCVDPGRDVADGHADATSLIRACR